MTRIRLTGLTKVFDGGVTALDRLDLTVEPGEFFALLGPSGCGKTTLLRTMAGLEQATSGTIRFAERDVTRVAPGDRDVAMVFQDYALFPHMTVVDNISYPLKVKGRAKPERTARAEEVGRQLGLEALTARRPSALSGGQQQRVALARAVACRPALFLFDEPLSNLDARLRLEARGFLKRLQRELGVTTVFVTHDQAEALALADRIAVMESGRVRQLGTPREVFARPADTFVANFIGSTPMNLVPAEVEGDRLRVAGGVFAAPQGVVAGSAKVTAGIRPEYLRLHDAEPTDAPDAPTGTVSILENLGATTLVTVDCGGESLSAVVPEDAEPAPGSRVWLTPQPGRLLVYDNDSGELLPRRDPAG
ncbi:multiple sugar transport system ATP-binding protein [Stackebrandtia albiflava]|uniref:Multiple sugar transport system ATP-binding protein n=1 Tax=Stackebrandtia albiflava TaxID=406432 RepID=A0A562VBV5_9ACTN|nr:ABC transporter ATP-binding protein [Stackebrandtia albiflava]TWJ15338.1 multiple sugar transport system ATP-binding protein [Stackebrandtia albiflava]